MIRAIRYRQTYERINQSNLQKNIITFTNAIKQNDKESGCGNYQGCSYRPDNLRRINYHPKAQSEVLPLKLENLKWLGDVYSE